MIDYDLELLDDGSWILELGFGYEMKIYEASIFFKISTEHSKNVNTLSSKFQFAYGYGYN